MTPEQAAALVNSQTQLCIAEMARMHAANQERAEQDLAPAYGEEQWIDFYDHWDAIIGYNAVIGLYNKCN